MKSFPMGRPRRIPTKEWLLSLIEIDENDCWIWQGTKAKNGYGVVKSNYKQLKAHRLALELIAGLDVPDDMLVCHTCDVKLCINPDHLYIGTAYDNNWDRMRRNRSSYVGAPKHMVCVRGHPRHPANIYESSNGCKICSFIHRNKNKKRDLCMCGVCLAIKRNRNE